MEWVDRMNQAISYVESHLCGEIDTDEIGRIMACPFVVFQRFFVQLTGMPLSEYARRRRLTCAAYDIQNSSEKIIDIALRYGYESPDAFCVAFKRLHGVAPAMARQSSAGLKFCSRLTFTVSIRGVTEMDYRSVEREPFKVIGIRHTTPSGGGTWAICKSDGSLERMKEMGGDSCVSLGLCFGFDDEGNNDYMVGIEYQQEDPPGLESFSFPRSTWLVFEAAGAISENVLGNTWTRIYGEFLPQSEYKPATLPTIEAYHVWDADADRCRVEIWIPVDRGGGG